MKKSSKTECGCDDYKGTTRRGFLRGGLAVSGGFAVTATYGSVITETAYAATPVSNVLVVLSMRGAADGLSLMVPHSDPVYYQARPSINVPKNRLLVPDSNFGLHPSLSPLMGLWNSGKMAGIHATGQIVTTRSHFAAMEEVEDADPGSSVRSGWLNRLVGYDGTGSPIEAVQMGSGGVPIAAMVGNEPVLVASNVDGVSLSAADNETARRNSLNQAWAGSIDVLGDGMQSALQVVSDFKPVQATSTTPSNNAVYPDGGLGDALQATARTIRANVGAQVITVDHGSWDHHTWIGNPDSGNMKNMATELAGNIAAFFTDLGSLADKVTLVTISEFGRRVVENANQGLDHGHGNVMFAFGAGVKGGYYGKWPGLAKTTDADLAVTTDYRTVLNEIVTKRFSASTANVFPGFTPDSSIGFITSL